MATKNFIDKESLQTLVNQVNENSELLNSKVEYANEVVNNDVSYTKAMPDDVGEYAIINKVGGMTRKCKNLLHFPYVHESGRVSAGVTYIVNEDGSVTESGTATANSFFTFSNSVDLKGGSVYTLSSGLILSYRDTNEIIKYESKDFLWDDSYTLLQIYMQTAPGVTASRTIYPMLNEGATALPYEPYFEGLRDAKVTEIESVGVNLFGGEVLADKFVALSNATKDEVAGTVAFTAPQASGDVYYNAFKPDTVYTFILYGKTTNDRMANLSVLYTDGTNERVAFNAVDTEGYCVYTTTSGKTVDRFTGSNMSGITTLYYDKCGIFEGVLTVDDFKPYVRNTLPIPKEVQALDGYGEGVNESVYNYIDWEKKQFVKSAGCVDLGTLGWVIASGYETRFASLHSESLNIKNGTGNIICSKYPSGNNKVFIYESRIYVDDSSYTDAASFKAAMAGEMLYYELAEPIITDISDILPADNLLGVEGGGMLTFKNEYEYDVPSEISYALGDSSKVIVADTFIGDLQGKASQAERVEWAGVINKPNFITIDEVNTKIAALEARIAFLEDKLLIVLDAPVIEVIEVMGEGGFNLTFTGDFEAISYGDRANGEASLIINGKNIGAWEGKTYAGVETFSITGHGGIFHGTYADGTDFVSGDFGEINTFTLTQDLTINDFEH